jgi:pimeloyl-ACP methyl ester carboxylesterase
MRTRPAARLLPALFGLATLVSTVGAAAGSLTVRREPPAQPAQPTDNVRPQHPVRPFAYEEREVKVEYTPAGADKPVTLAGTLTIPDKARFGEGPFAAVILITGSGPQDRDETLLGHKPFLVISDDLTKRGVAVLRLDDRGVGGSSGPVESATTHDLAADISAALEFLGLQAGVDPKRIGLIGHSEGGIIAPMVAASHPDRVAFIVLLAGTGVQGRDVLPAQVGAMARAGGAPEHRVAELEAAQRRAIDLFVAADTPKETIAEEMKRLVAIQFGYDPDPAKQSESRRGEVERTARQGLLQFESPWMKAFLTLDPRDYLRKVRCPVLVLNGGLDRQVLAEQNVPEITRTLLQAGNHDVTVRVFPRLNHLFQTARSGTVMEYAFIRETFAPEALSAMGEWVVRRAGEGEARGGITPEDGR